MMLTRLKSDLAQELAKTSLNSITTDFFNSPSRIIELLETPRSLEHGELALPVFSLAKSLRRAPPLIAQELVENLKGRLTNVQDLQAVSGYLNFRFATKYLQDLLRESLFHLPEVLRQSENIEKTFVIDYSSPNIAKPMSIGHLRATVIGQALRNLAETQGYKVIGINHLGDWGVQFGKLAWAYLQWGGDYDFTAKPFDAFYLLYVRFHEESEKNKELELKGAECFRRLEAGDTEVREIWKYFVEVSLKEYERIYGLLGVKFDLIQGEAFYNDHLKPTIDRIEKAGILESSEGAKVVFINDKDPPCIIVKSDGSSLYATRDLASAIYRKENLRGDKIVYVVGVDQTLHFQQVFAVLKKMGLEWWGDCHHVAFGMYRFKDEGRMSTRKGRVIFMDDVLEKAIEIVREIIEVKNPALQDKTQVARQVGVGAIIFNDLMNDRIKNVDFDWERALDFEGDSGPYVQYCYVRCMSLIRKFGREPPVEFKAQLDSTQERELVKQLFSYDEVLRSSFKNFKPNILAQYLLDLCRAFSHMYQTHRILDGEQDLKESRMLLIHITKEVIAHGLKVLGIQTPEMM